MSEKVNDAAHPPRQLQALQTAHDLIMVNPETNHPAAAAAETEAAGPNAVDRVISRVGHLTRVLHDSLQELGYNKRLEQAASEIPDAQDRLSYVAVMTEQAAERALSATEIAKPIQDRLAADAALLARRWQAPFDGEGAGQPQGDAFKKLVEQTRTYLADVPNRVNATNAQLMEIMMAQDFQDLTGQVIEKITRMVHNLEQELLRLLMDNIPSDKCGETGAGLMNGPVVNPERRSDVVTNQNQVDDLLASLGF